MWVKQEAAHLVGAVLLLVGSKVRGVSVSAFNVRQVPIYLYQTAPGTAGCPRDDKSADCAERLVRMLGQTRLKTALRLA
ncbi:hypothetical protein XP56_01950 [Xanthomonas perforans]|nr:hypothetical protein XP56_01950 [Xanthomonas perforans]